MLTGSRSPLLLPYGDIWRKERRVLHQGLMSSIAPSYTPQQELEGIRMLRGIIDKPEEYEIMFEQFSVGVAMRIIYGLRLGSGHDYEARTILEIVHEFERTASPGAYLVDLFPSMMMIPDFLAPWKRKLKANQRREEAFYVEMLGRTMKDLADGKDMACWARNYLENKSAWGLDEPCVVSLLGGAFEAAGGTTAAAMMSFGVGRRMCPGVNIAERSLNLQVALLAWGCGIGRARDEAGEEIVPPHYDFVDGFNVQPKTFKFDLKVRSKAKEALIEGAYQQALRDDSLC